MALSFKIGTDNSVKIIGLQDNDEGAYVNDATVTANLYNTSDMDTPVAGGSGIPLTYITDSDGNYRGHIPDTITWTEGDRYILRVEVVSGTKKWTFDIERVAAYHKVGMR